MKFEQFGIEGREIRFGLLETIMEHHRFVREQQWDYERAMYDMKYEKQSTGEVFYLRIPVYAIQGEIEDRHAVVRMMTPLLGKHYYPHGVEYDEVFPSEIVADCERRLAGLIETLEK
ncbi:YugN family protein [Exiguobacterium flavidum]|uniref:YugN family protein n=1 Tax=Exiguobacterium flavidum TaxID=2184695 RepID=UPI000DF75943|nr:YugN family protein [Exiguobacterium flavidum]